MFDPGTYILLFLALLTLRGIGPVVGLFLRVRYLLPLVFGALVLVGRGGTQPWYPNALVFELLVANLLIFFIFLHVYGHVRTSAWRWTAHLLLGIFWNLEVYFLAPNIFVEPNGMAQIWFLDLLNKGLLTFCIPILEALGLGDASGFVFAYFRDPFLFFSRQLIPIHFVGNYALIGLLYRLAQPHIRGCAAPEPIFPKHIHPAFVLLPLGLWLGNFSIGSLYVGLLTQGMIGLYAVYGITVLSNWLLAHLPQPWKAPVLGGGLGLILLHPEVLGPLALFAGVAGGLRWARWLTPVADHRASVSVERWLNPLRLHLLLTVSLGVAVPMLLLWPFSFRPYYERPVEPKTVVQAVPTHNGSGATAAEAKHRRDGLQQAASSPAHVIQTEPWQQFQVDRYEFPNRPQALPTTGLSPDEAERSCQREGKQLCTIEQWYQACSLGGRFPTLESWAASKTSSLPDEESLSKSQGLRSQPHPRCNLADRREFARLDAWLSWLGKGTLRILKGDASSSFDSLSRHAANDDMVDSKGLGPHPELAPSGAYSTCKNALGLFDIIGNAYEWVRLEEHEGMWGLAGSYYRYSDTVTNRCDMHLYVHQSQFQIIDLDAIGFRCCQ